MPLEKGPGSRETPKIPESVRKNLIAAASAAQSYTGLSAEAFAAAGLSFVADSGFAGAGVLDLHLRELRLTTGRSIEI